MVASLDYLGRHQTLGMQSHTLGGRWEMTGMSVLGTMREMGVMMLHVEDDKNDKTSKT